MQQEASSFIDRLHTPGAGNPQAIPSLRRLVRHIDWGKDTKDRAEMVMEDLRTGAPKAHAIANWLSYQGIPSSLVFRLMEKHRPSIAMVEFDIDLITSILDADSIIAITVPSNILDTELRTYPDKRDAVIEQGTQIDENYSQNDSLKGGKIITQEREGGLMTIVFPPHSIYGLSLIGRELRWPCDANTTFQGLFYFLSAKQQYLIDTSMSEGNVIESSLKDIAKINGELRRLGELPKA